MRQGFGTEFWRAQRKQGEPLGVLLTSVLKSEVRSNEAERLTLGSLLQPEAGPAAVRDQRPQTLGERLGQGDHRLSVGGR